MLSFNQSIYNLLYARVDPLLLRGYYGGIFNASGTQFFAATYVNEVPADDNELEELKRKGRHSYAIYGPPSHYVPDGKEGWISMPPEPDNIRECNACSFIFYAAYHGADWYVLPSLSFFRGINEAEAKTCICPADPFATDLYKPQYQLDWARSLTIKEFGNIPWLVAEQLRERKEKVNHAFRQYLLDSVLTPLAIRLRIHYPERYNSMAGMFGMEHFSVIFPVHKRFILLPTTAKGSTESKTSLRYLLYRCDTGEVFEWTYFSAADENSGPYADNVIEQLQTITYWNNYQYMQSSCTLDDDLFWEKFVFAEENGAPVYLRKLDIVLPLGGHLP